MSYWQRGKRAAIMSARLAVVLATISAFNYVVTRWLAPALIYGWFTVPLALICLGFVVGQAYNEAAARFVMTGQLRTDKRGDD